MRAPDCRFDVPFLGFGIGLRTVHYPAILDVWPTIDWFEAISENYMRTHGRPRDVLDRVAARYPVVLHGVSLSIGSTDPFDRAYLRHLGALARRVRAPWLSDHVCWTGAAHHNSHDLLPCPYNEASLRHMVARVREVQDILERPIALENPSSYVEFRSSDMPEWEFVARLAEEADCALLLDVNNVYVSSVNHRFAPERYIDAIPPNRVVQYHLAGHTRYPTHILDTHSDHVIPDVWALYRRAWARTGPRSTLVEWDDDIPAFDVVHAEVLEARRQVGFIDG
jgi:uncharacterized protein (UPF0276 family)